MRRVRSPISVLAAIAATAGLAFAAAACAGGEQKGSDAGGAARGETTRQASGEAGMSLRDEVGQMFVVSMGGTEPDYYIEKMIRERNIGGVLLFGYNMKSEEQVSTLTRSLQDLSMQTQPAVPLFVAVDYEGGEVASAPWVREQPAAADVGAQGNASRAGEIAQQIGTDLLRAGVNTDFAPVVDTGFGAAIGSRSYGEDPQVVSQMGAEAVKGFERAGIVSAAKHFPNHGPATTDSHKGLPVIDHDRQKMEEYDLPPFRAAVDAGVPMVMVGHLVYPAVDPNRPGSLSPQMIGLLRDDVGFDGVVVSDDLSMQGATGGGEPGDAAVAAVKAGVDLLIISSAPQEQADAYDAVVDAVESGEIPRERIRASVDRILAVKREYGFYEGGAG